MPSELVPVRVGFLGSRMGRTVVGNRVAKKEPDIKDGDVMTYHYIRNKVVVGLSSELCRFIRQGFGH